MTDNDVQAPDTPEGRTALELYAASNRLALDPNAPTKLAADLREKARKIARLEISQRSEEYRKLKDKLDSEIKDLSTQLDELQDTVEAVKTATLVAGLAGKLLQLAASLVMP